MRKKVIIIIVEGPSDLTILEELLYENFNSFHLHIEIIYGDLFADKTLDKGIKATLGDKIREVQSRTKFLIDDILAVIQILDTDGCYINEDLVTLNSMNPEGVLYKPTHIEVNPQPKVQQICDRNSLKKQRLNTMNSVTHIMGNAIPYQIFYFSCNLEHVLYDEMNTPKSEKTTKANNFVNDNPDSEDIIKLLKQFMAPCDSDSYVSKYKESWLFIQEGVNSLNRFTNVLLVFEYISQ